MVYSLNHHSIYGTVSPIVRIHWPRNQRVKEKIVPITIMPSDPLKKKKFLVHMTLGSDGLEGFGSRGVVLQLDPTTNITLNWKLEFPLASLKF